MMDSSEENPIFIGSASYLSLNSNRLQELPIQYPSDSPAQIETDRKSFKQLLRSPQNDRDMNELSTPPSHQEDMHQSR